MAEHCDTPTMVDRLLALNREAFEAGPSTTVSHLLAAALPEAQADQAARLLVRVQHITEEQCAWMDCSDPASEHVTPSAEAAHGRLCR